jgi:MFS family permease
MDHDHRRAGGLAGLAVAPVYFGIVILVTALEWDWLHDLGWSVLGDYDLPYPSVIARGDFGTLQMLNFAVIAVLVAVFARGFRQEFRHRPSGGIATGALVLCTVAVAMDVAPANLPGEAASWHDTVHGIGFFLFILGSMVSMVASALALRGNDDWRGWRWLGWTPVLLVAVTFASGAMPGETGLLLFLVLMIGWFSVIGGHLAAMARDRDLVRRPSAIAGPASPGLL